MTPGLEWEDLNLLKLEIISKGGILGCSGQGDRQCSAAILLIGEQRWLPLEPCSSRGQKGVPSRLGAQNCIDSKRPLPVYGGPGVDSSIGLHPSLNSRTNFAQ